MLQAKIDQVTLNYDRCDEEKYNGKVIYKQQLLAISQRLFLFLQFDIQPLPETKRIVEHSQC